jgi:hypothetical protein
MIKSKDVVSKKRYQADMDALVRKIRAVSGASAGGGSSASANEPTADEKAALAGTSGSPSAANKYVTDQDPRNTNTRTPSAHKASHEPGGGDALAVDAAAATGSLRTLGTGPAQACAGNDARLSDARTPTTHGNSVHTTGVAAGASAPGDSAAQGSSAAVARADHRHSREAFGTTAGTVCQGNDSRLSDARTPAAHAASHKSGGSDPVKLDELAAPDDNATLNASASKHGLLRKLSGIGTQALTGDGAWTEIVAAAGIIKVLSVVSDSARNSNPNQKSTASSSYVKLKEIALGEPTRGIRIKFTLWTSNASYPAYAQIYRNGSPIGTERSSSDMVGEIFSEDFNVDWAQGDLTQIYVHRSGTATAYIDNMQFCYNRALASFGSWHLATFLPTTEQTAYTVTNQDP